MHPEVALLAEFTEAAANLLVGCGENAWAERLRKDAQRIKSLDFYGVEHLRTMFGGMGSFNDLVLHPRNGHSIKAVDVSAANEKLDELRSKIYSLVGKLYAEEISAQHVKK
jgi:hypothetical protein